MSSIPQRFVPITVADYGGAQVGQGGGQDGVADDYYAQGQVTNVRGRHQLKTGLEYRTARSLVENPYRGANLAAFNFTRNFTSLRPNVATSTAADGGNAFASFLLGYALPTAQRPAARRRSTGGTRTSPAYLQDDWRLSNRLTVNLGLRWDYEAADHRARQPGERRASTTTASRWSARPVRRRGCRPSCAAG